MEITYECAKSEDIEPIYQLCKGLIDAYERIDQVDYERILRWVRRKIETSIGQYTAVFADGRKAGYYHFYRNQDGVQELDDLYIFPEFQNLGIGSTIIRRCCASVEGPVMLYVFIDNHRAVSLYKRLGFQIVKTLNSRYIMESV